MPASSIKVQSHGMNINECIVKVSHCCLTISDSFESSCWTGGGLFEHVENKQLCLVCVCETRIHINLDCVMKSWHYFISSSVRKLSEIILGPVESGDRSVKLTLTFNNGLFSIVMKTLSPDIMSTIDHGAMDKNIFNFYAGNYGSSACKLFQTFQL